MVTGKRGRPRVSSQAQVETTALELFLERGYAETSIADIVAAAGISKTTFFRYYPSKGALVWSAFERGTRQLREVLEQAGDEAPVMEVIRLGVIETVDAQIDDEGIWSTRFRILEESDELQAEWARRGFAWAEVLATFVASRVGARPTAVVPVSIGGAVQYAVLAVLREGVGLSRSRESLLSELGGALASLCRILQGWLDESSTAPSSATASG